jgi:hypothetical protein
MIGINLVDTLGVDNGTLQKFKDVSNSDETSRVVMEYVVKGWPAEKDQLDELAREYWSFREELSVEDGLLFKSDRIVVPRSLRAEVLEEVHGAHMGESKSLSFAREYAFWPSMTAQIKDKVSSCPICNAFRDQQQRETLHLHGIPGLPWQVVSTDIFEFAGHSYFLVIDFYSKDFEIELLRQITATYVINYLKKIFARFGRFGIPSEIMSDNGSQYSNTRNLFSNTHEFKKFADEWGFRHITSSPEYPQSNGAAEKAVQTAKRILKKASADNKDAFEGLSYVLKHALQGLGRFTSSAADELTKRNISKRNYDRHSRDLPLLHVGDKVRIRPNRETEWRRAEVLPRSYVLGVEQARVYQ